MKKGISNIGELIKSIKPVLHSEEFVFCTMPKNKVNDKISPIMQFEEKEGTTIVVRKKIADMNSFEYGAVWSLITLSVHSDLEAVGFLAAVTDKLAKNKISVNAVSAYYHDHIFVPKEKAEKAMRILRDLQKSGRY